MKRVLCALAALPCLLTVTSLSAQPPGGPGGAGPAGFHLMSALDVDQDGKLSATEIANATLALAKLDKDNNGKLSADEIGWPPVGGFPGGPGGPGGFPGFGAPNEPVRRPPDVEPFFSYEQLKRLDRNQDGRITKDEIPKRMRPVIFGRLDSNKDEQVDSKELATMAPKKKP